MEETYAYATQEQSTLNVKTRPLHKTKLARRASAGSVRRYR